jgi:phytanoyl-CoA hydroxylase
MPTATALRHLSADLVASYRSRGFCRVEGLLSPEECAMYRAESLQLAAQTEGLNGQAGTSYRKALVQRVNIWRESPMMASLTLHPQLCAWATQLAGVPMRLWNDHALIKEPMNGAPTEFHQDQPYWPHLDSAQPISAWIALQDVPAERGCMSFIPGSQHLTNLSATDLTDARGLFNLRPELVWHERVTLPLKAGDLTFHHGRTAHMANANATDQHRVAHTVIFMPRTTRFSGSGHVVTKDAGFAPGDLLQGPLFPDV